MARKPKKPAAATYDPPGRYEIAQWLADPLQRVRDYHHTFSGETGQRVLFDLLHNICGFGAKPMPMSALPGKPAITLDRMVGRQDVAVDLIEVMSLSLRELIEENIRRFSNE